jgi:hypothetical protein
MKTIPSLIIKVLATTIIIVVFVPACKKQDDASSTAGQQEFAAVSAVSDASAEVVFDDVFNNAMGVNAEVGIGGTGVFARVDMSASTTNASANRVAGVDSASCYAVTISQLSTTARFPLQITIDFGAGCTGRDGRIRKGKIIIEYSGKLIIPGNSASVRFDGYYLDNIKIEGNQKITNTGTLAQKSYTTLVTNAKLSQSNGNFIQWNSEKTITQVEGMATALIALDDVFNITGQANGSAAIDSKYFQWSTSITSPLVKRFACRWISKGALSLRKGSAGVAVLDYGAGACDNKANFSVNNVVHEITLH